MRKRIRIAAWALACLGLAVGAAAEGEGYDEQAMMEAWMKAAQTGEQHAGLAHMVGHWKTKTTNYENGQAGEPTEGTAEFVSLLGGRVIRGTHKGTMMGSPYEGMSLDGYDNVTGEYWSTWNDTMATGLYVTHGKRIADDQIEYHGTMTMPMGIETKMRFVNTFGTDSGRMDMYMTMPGSDEEALSMVIEYTRAM